MTGQKGGNRADVVDRLLLLAVIWLAGCLMAQLGQLGCGWWQGWARPGVQARQQLIGKLGTGTHSREIGANYLLYLPTRYRRQSQWPLVIFLHGAGERGANLDMVRRVGLPARIEAGERPGFLLASPQCPPKCTWDPETIVALVEHLAQTWSVDRERVYLTGFSMGGSGTWRTACFAPDRFAAIAPLAGGGTPAQAKRLVQLPVWAFHGAKDETVPLEESEKMVDAVRAAGGHARLTVYDCRGHGIADRTYAQPEFWDWLLAQRRGSGREEGHSSEMLPVSSRSKERGQEESTSN